MLPNSMHNANVASPNSPLLSAASMRLHNPSILSNTSFNPLYRPSADGLTSFDASQFIFLEQNDRGGAYKNRVKNKLNNRTKPSAIIQRHNSENGGSATAVHHPSEQTVNYVEKTPTSTGSRHSSSQRQECEAREFLERYSLPRVVRIGDGEPFLLYRCIDNFTKIEVKRLCKKPKDDAPESDLHFPEGYPGWFSLLNEKGERGAIAYTSILQLVREQVCAFLSTQPFTAYACQTSETTDKSDRIQYLKTQVLGGQLFQLRAVFQHKERPDGSTKRSTSRASRISSSIRDKDLANRYAQLVNQNNQEFYAPLTAKGQFYETHSSMKARLCFPGMLDKTGPLALDKDCLYKITHLIRRVALPIKVKLISGPLPTGTPNDSNDTFILERQFQEPLMVTCSLPPPNNGIPTYTINCINLTSNVKLLKCTLGFDSENRLFKSQRLQAALAYCHKNVEHWYREVRLVPNIKQEATPHHHPVKPTRDVSVNVNIDPNKSTGLSLNTVVEEENDHQHHQDPTSDKQLITTAMMEKFPKSKRWFKHLRILSRHTNQRQRRNPESDPMTASEKTTSIDRYKDMSKLIEDKFGKKNYNPVKKSASFMFAANRFDLDEELLPQFRDAPGLLKCQSLDTQLCTMMGDAPVNEQKKEDSDTNLSVLSYDFQMCILEDEEKPDDDPHESVQTPRCREQVVASQTVSTESTKLGKRFKSKPDLIPTLPPNRTDHSTSLITDRLCSEFHVKTKVQGRRNEARAAGRFAKKLAQFEGPPLKTAVVQIHENHTNSNRTPQRTLDDIPYSHVADDVTRDHSLSEIKLSDENIYAEISEMHTTICGCDENSVCTCKNTTDGYKKDCYYVKLGSNGDSGVQSDTEETIYNTIH